MVKQQIKPSTLHRLGVRVGRVEKTLSVGQMIDRESLARKLDRVADYLYCFALEGESLAACCGGVGAEPLRQFAEEAFSTFDSLSQLFSDLAELLSVGLDYDDDDENKEAMAVGKPQSKPIP